MTEAAAALPPAAVRLADAQRLLSLFAQGIAGRYLHLKPVEPSAAREARGGGLAVDGSELRLPEAIADFDLARHNLGAYRVRILHQLGYLEHGSLAFSMHAARARIPGLPAESPDRDPSAPALERFFGLWPSPVLMRRLFGVLEAMRVDLSIRRRYPGARADLDRVLAHALAQRPPIDAMTPQAALLEGLLRHSLGARRASLLAQDATGLLGGLLDAAEVLADENAGVHDSAAAAAAAYRLLARAGLARPLPEDLALADPAAAASEDGGPGKGDAPGIPEGDVKGDPDAPPLEDAPVLDAVSFRGEVDLAVLQRGLQAAGIVASIDGADLVIPEGDPEASAPEQPARRAPAASVRRAEQAHDGATRTYLYDEWDFHAQAYLSGWCRLHEQRLKGDDHDFLHKVRERHAALLQQVKRQFRHIRPESRQRARRVSDGEELELDGIIETVIDRRAGHATDERLYMRRDRALRDVAAAFLLDMSASTDIPVPDREAPPPQPVEATAPADAGGEEDIPYLWTLPVERDEPGPGREPRRVIDVGRESMALMCEALQTLGDRYAIYGFSGYGREQVEFYVAKEFDDRLSARTWAAIGAMEPRKSTRMGPAIRHALAKLERQPTRMKVLVVVSDGFPQDRDYGPDRNDDEYGVQDTARALLEAERAGVQTFMVTIDPTGHDYLRRMCREERYMVIDEVADLPEALTKVYRALTA